MPGSPMIELRGVRKEYEPGSGRGRRPVVALDGITLMVPRGETWAVVGPNGAGKTTLFGVLLGFLHPTAGAVRIDGESPRRYLRRRGAGYLPERFRLPGEWTVRGALLALARLEGLDGAAAGAAVDRVIGEFWLGEHAGKPLGALSRGLLQRVGLAQALLADRELVVFDEPTEGLDPLWRIRFRELVARLGREGRTVLVASHELAEVERIAERAVLLEGGRVREVLEIARGEGEPRRYLLELAAPAPSLADAFPGAVPAPEGGARYLVTVADAAELSARLAALLATGAVLVAVHPAAEALEDRVRRVLSGGGA